MGVLIYLSMNRPKLRQKSLTTWWLLKMLRRPGRLLLLSHHRHRRPIRQTHFRRSSGRNSRCCRNSFDADWRAARRECVSRWHVIHSLPIIARSPYTGHESAALAVPARTSTTTERWDVSDNLPGRRNLNPALVRFRQSTSIVLPAPIAPESFVEAPALLKMAREKVGRQVLQHKDWA